MGMTGKLDEEPNLQAINAVIEEAEKNPDFWDMKYLYEQRNKLCKFPDFQEIVKKSKEKMLEKFPQYGNSWQEESFLTDWSWWEKRLKNEIKEIWESSNPITTQEEIIDAINILAMMYENNKKYVEFHYNDLKYGRYG